MLGGVRVAAAQAEAEFDLEISLKAPQHVAPGSNPIINLSYSNIGTADAPADTSVQVWLPGGLSFVSAVDQEGSPLPPTSIDGNLLTWGIGALPAGSCCAHIWITTLVAADLAEETLLSLPQVPNLREAQVRRSATAHASRIISFKWKNGISPGRKFFTHGLTSI